MSSLFLLASDTAGGYYIDMTERGKFTTTLDIELIKQIKILAIKRGCSANDLIELAINEYLKKYEKEAHKEMIDKSEQQIPRALKGLMSAIEGQVMHYVRDLPLKDDSEEKK